MRYFSTSYFEALLSGLLISGLVACSSKESPTNSTPNPDPVSSSSENALSSSLNSSLSSSIPISSGTITSSALISSSSETSSTSRPSISDIAVEGLFRFGETIRVTYTYNHPDDVAEGASTIQWICNNEPIPGANADTLVVSQQHNNCTIRVFITPVTAEEPPVSGTAARSTTFGTITDWQAPEARQVSISGQARAGDTLRATYVYYDAENDPEGASQYQWFRSRQPIEGANDTIYAITPEDNDAILSFKVTPVANSEHNPVGEAVEYFNNTFRVRGYTPPSVSNLSGFGTATQNGSITVRYTYADVENDPEGNSIYQWYRDGSEISDATDTTYSITYADSGAILSFVVTPVAQTGFVLQGTPDTISFGPVTGFRFPTATSVTIAGDRITGSLLNATYTYADADGDAQGATEFQWFRNGDSIAAANSQAYTPTLDDVGAILSVEITPVALTGINTRGASVRRSLLYVIHDTFTDTRDNQTYKTITLGNQTWFAQNLNYNTSGLTHNTQTSTGSDVYGRLYNWVTMTQNSQTNRQGICPTGWLVPNNADWDTLFAYLENERGVRTTYIGEALKADSLWASSYKNGDAIGFSALPAGGAGGDQTLASQRTGFAYFWSASHYFSTYLTAEMSYAYYLTHTSSSITRTTYNQYQLQLSVRCIKE